MTDDPMLLTITAQNMPQCRGCGAVLDLKEATYCIRCAHNLLAKYEGVLREIASGGAKRANYKVAREVLDNPSRTRRGPYGRAP